LKEFSTILDEKNNSAGLIAALWCFFESLKNDDPEYLNIYKGYYDLPLGPLDEIER
jgi:hypothetical protein